VPVQPLLDEAELIRRIRAFYGTLEASRCKERWAEWRKNGLALLADREQDGLRRRMGDISPFMKLLKQCYSISYNHRHSRVGTLWEGRYASILVESESRALSVVAAYVDLNPVRAGIVEDPADYRWSGYGEACGGSTTARQGIRSLLSASQQELTWSDALATYRKSLYTQGEEVRDDAGRLQRIGFSPEVASEVIERNGKMPLPALLRCRVRYFKDGLAFGSRTFVESVFERNRAHFGFKRKTGARRMRFCQDSGFCAARDLRVEVVSIPLRV
jgi:putative transposase